MFSEPRGVGVHGEGDECGRTYSSGKKNPQGTRLEKKRRGFSPLGHLKRAPPILDALEGRKTAKAPLFVRKRKQGRGRVGVGKGEKRRNYVTGTFGSKKSGGIEMSNE